MPIAIVGVAALAVVLVLMYFAGERLHITPFQGIGNVGGTVGGLLLRWVAASIGWAIRQAESDIKAGIRGIEGVFLWPVYWAAQHIESLTTRIYQLYQVCRRILSVSIPGAMASALGTARNWVILAEQGLGARIDSVAAWAGSQFTAAYRYVNTEIALAEGYAQHLVAQAEAYAASGIAADAKYAEGLFSTAIGYTDEQAKILEGWVTGQLANVTAWAGADITALQKYIAASQTQLLTWAQAAIGVVAVDLANLKLDCTDNLCANLGGAANLLNDLSGSLGVAGLYALVAAAAADPAGTADVIDAVLGPLANGGAQAFVALVGA